MTWRNCKASIALVDEVNHRWPSRDKSSDGTIGDAAHASRKSDHNPWVKDADGTGVVRARDIDEDLDGNTANTGADAQFLLDHLLALARAGDPRLNGGGYLIYERAIYSEKNGWTGRPYSGINAHDHHLHVSFSLNASGYDSTAPWNLWPTTPPPPPASKDWLDMLNDDEQAELLTKVRDLHDDYAVSVEPGDKHPRTGKVVPDGTKRWQIGKLFRRAFPKKG